MTNPIRRRAFLGTVARSLAGTALMLITGAYTAGHGQTPAGSPLLPGRVSDLSYYGGGDAAAIVRQVAVTGQPFVEALQVDTYARPDTTGDFGLVARINGTVREGDVLWVSFKVRCLQSSRETGEASFELRLDRMINGKYVWPPFLERGVSAGAEWTEVSIPFVMERSVTPDETRLIMRFDSYPQRFEISPITLLNCGNRVSPAELPRSVVRYEGDAPDAPWRKAAAERIERLRKGPLALKVTDEAGQPLADAQLAVRMQRIAFNFGTAIDSKWILHTTDPDAHLYREQLRKHFNQVVFENEMKWKFWADPKHDPSAILRALDWLDAIGLPARGHVMVWPSFRHLPASLRPLKDNPPALRAAVFDFIAKQTSLMPDRFAEWDVTNEVSLHHELVDIFGREEMVRWYEAARRGAPGAKLFYNEYTMFHVRGTGTQHFYDTVKYLKEQGAPIDGIGEQAHIGGTPPPIPFVLARLDKFSELGLPITITEFDINSNDDDLKASYLRDFMTAVFSHPNTTGIVQWGFWEGHHWFPVAALWNKDWSLRKHGQVYTELVGKIWRTDADGGTNPEGTFVTRAFYGDYDVTITQAGRTGTFRVKHHPGAGEQQIVFRR